MYRTRHIEASIRHHLDRGKSILLLGPRQTGKSTLLERFTADLKLSFSTPSVRLRYERDPELLVNEIVTLKKKIGRKKPLIIIDEVQKVPDLFDVLQSLIDNSSAIFILSGSSARKIRRQQQINMLPGRVVSLRLDPFTIGEWQEGSLEERLIFGSLPGISLVKNGQDKEDDLRSYVETYLEEEIRAEAVVRNLGVFSRFLELAGLESGRIVSFRAISQDLGVAHTTVTSYFEVLEDCLVAERIEPITYSATRKKLTKSCRYLFFDLGIRRVSAKEGQELGEKRLGELFEQFVGLELLRTLRLERVRSSLHFWRDSDGPEVDWIVKIGQKMIPVEVKWSKSPKESDVKHLNIFLDEYKAAEGFVVCRCSQAYQISDRITAIPWIDLRSIIS